MRVAVMTMAVPVVVMTVMVVAVMVVAMMVVAVVTVIVLIRGVIVSLMGMIVVVIVRGHADSSATGAPPAKIGQAAFSRQSGPALPRAGFRDKRRECPSIPSSWPRT